MYAKLLRPVFDGPDFKPYQYPKIRHLDHWHDYYHSKYAVKDSSAPIYDGLLEKLYQEVRAPSQDLFLLLAILDLSLIWCDLGVWNALRSDDEDSHLHAPLIVLILGKAEWEALTEDSHSLLHTYSWYLDRFLMMNDTWFDRESQDVLISYSKQHRMSEKIDSAGAQKGDSAAHSRAG